MQAHLLCESGVKMRNLRDYGLPNPAQVIGTPTWTEADATAPACPNCGGKLAAVTVKVEMPMLRGGKGTGRYLGCPACPFASPMMCAADGDTTDEDKKDEK
jgi:hypothetical protein